MGSTDKTCMQGSCVIRKPTSSVLSWTSHYTSFSLLYSSLISSFFFSLFLLFKEEMLLSWCVSFQETAQESGITYLWEAVDILSSGSVSVFQPPYWGFCYFSTRATIRPHLSWKGLHNTTGGCSQPFVAARLQEKALHPSTCFPWTSWGGSVSPKAQACRTLVEAGVCVWIRR